MEKRIVIRSVALATALLSAHVLSAAIPARYQELSSIAATGAQWIDTGYVPALNDIIVAKGYLANNASYNYKVQTFLSAYDENGFKGFSVSRLSGGTAQFQFFRNGSSVNTSTAIDAPIAIDVSADLGSLTAQANGQIVTLPGGDFETTGSLVVFACRSGESFANTSYFQLYRLRAFDKDGALLHDFRPAKDTQAEAGSVAACGLYDTVDGVFHPNGGTAALTAGSAVKTSDVGDNDLYLAKSGTVTLDSPVSYKNLYNVAAGGPVRLDQSGVAADEVHKNSFTGFFADASWSSTVFDGGLWDFGATADSTTCNFFGNDFLHYRTAVITGGAVVTNVGGIVLSGSCESSGGGQSPGVGNSLRVTGGSSLTANKVVLSTVTVGGAKSSFLVDGGSFFLCNKQFLFSNGAVGSNNRVNSGGLAVISNENTRAVFKGSLGVGANTDPGVNYGGNAPGGTTMIVTDKATVEAASIDIGGGSRNFDNIFIVSNSGRVNCTSINLTALAYNNKYDSLLSGDKLMILSGAVVTNTGKTAVGYVSSGSEGAGGSEIVVSNATFHTYSLQFSHGSAVKYNVLRVSGPDAVFTIDRRSQVNENGEENGYHPFGDAKSGGYNSWIFENGAKWQWPWARWCYNSYCHDQSVIVRTGATLSFRQMAMTSQSQTDWCKNNRLSIESGACATGNVCWVGNYQNVLSVSNATLQLGSDAQTSNRISGSGDGSALTVGGPLFWHGPATNDVLEIWGDEPKIELFAGGVDFWNESYCDFHLPSNGYREGVIPITVAKNFVMKPGCRLRFYGLEELCAYQKDAVGKTGKYTLIKAKSIVLPDDVMAEALAALPENCSLRIVDTDDGMKALVLKVRVPAGLLLLVR